MPAKSKAQLRKAHAALKDPHADAKTKKWARDTVKKTKSTKGLPERKKSKRPRTKATTRRTTRKRR